MVPKGSDPEAGDVPNDVLPPLEVVFTHAPVPALHPEEGRVSLRVPSVHFQLVGVQGLQVGTLTPGHEAQVFLYRNQDLMCGFFAWFSDNSLPESDRIAEIIKEDLWPKALQYYLLDKAPHRARLLQIREPVETPRPPGLQSD